MKAIWKYVWMKERWGQSRSTRLANSWDVWASFNKELPLAFIKHVKRAQAVPSSEDIWLSALFSSISLITTWFQAITFWMEIQISVKNPSPLFCCAPASLPTWTSILQQIEGSLILKDSQLLCQPHSIRDAWFGISQAAELCVLAWTEYLDVLKLVLPEHCWTPASQHRPAAACCLGKSWWTSPAQREAGGALTAQHDGFTEGRKHSISQHSILTTCLLPRTNRDDCSWHLTEANLETLLHRTECWIQSDTRQHHLKAFEPRTVDCKEWFTSNASTHQWKGNAIAHLVWLPLPSSLKFTKTQEAD